MVGTISLDASKTEVSELGIKAASAESVKVCIRRRQLTN